jgi:hypothetical protein
MKTKFLLLLLFTFATKLLQAQVLYDPVQGVSPNVVTNISSDAMAAQTFTVSNNGLLTEIMFYGGGMGGSTPLIVEIYKTSNGVLNDSPDNLLGQVRINANDLPTLDSWIKINVSTQNILVASTEKYALILGKPQYDGTSVYWRGTTTDQYEGNFYSKVQGNTWKEPNAISNEHIDMALIVNTSAELSPNPAVTTIDLSTTLTQSNSRIQQNNNITYTNAIKLSKKSR